MRKNSLCFFLMLFERREGKTRLNEEERNDIWAGFDLRGGIKKKILQTKSATSSLPLRDTCIVVKPCHSSWTWSAAAKSLQSCPTRCDPIDGSPPGSAIPGILQARTLEWVAISFSNAWKWKVKLKSLSRVWLFATPWTEDYQAPPSMGFSRQEYWSGVPLPSPSIAP